jgi:hypothetical protein
MTKRGRAEGALGGPAGAGPPTPQRAPSAAAAAEGAVEVPDAFPCSICHDAFVDPRRAPCGHALCSVDWERLFAAPSLGEPTALEARRPGCAAPRSPRALAPAAALAAAAATACSAAHARRAAEAAALRAELRARVPLRRRLVARVARGGGRGRRRRGRRIQWRRRGVACGLRVSFARRFPLCHTAAALTGRLSCRTRAKRPRLPTRYNFCA